MRQTKKFTGGVVKINMEKLENIQSAFASGMRTQIGILGNKAHNRKETVYTNGAEYLSGRSHKGSDASAQTNAEIGLLHEKGSLSRHIPRRSFLEWPLYMKGKELLSVKDELWAAFQKSDTSLKKAYRDLGIRAEQIIQRGFETRGFGSWADNSVRTILRKGSSQPLIDTAQLRRSVSSRVVGGEA